MPDWFSSSQASASNPYPSTSGGGASAAPGAVTQPNFWDTASGPVTLPNEWDQSTSQKWVDSYNKYIGQMTQAYQASSGLERDKLAAQIQNAQAGLQNAYKIAQLQANASKYGVDAQSKTAMAQLQENQRQFDANHALDLQKYGLNVADSYTKYAQTPDMVWALNDFKDAMNRVGQGLTPTAMGANPRIGTPQPKTWDDFSVLSGYGANGLPNGTTPGAGAAVGASTDASGGGPGAGAGSATGSTTDPRMSAISATMKAMPPSGDNGLNDQDWGALQNIKNLYFSGAPGSLEALGPARQKIAESGLARMGIDPAAATADYKQRGLGQGSALAA